MSVARITDGRYRRVRIDDESLDISVVAPEKGDWVDIRELSDGTLGQIYLAARLGLIRYATGDRRPPLILDDPFVTFDDDHAARGFDILRELTARSPGDLPDLDRPVRSRPPTRSSSCRDRPRSTGTTDGEGRAASA